MQHACRIENAVVPGMDMFVRGRSDRYTLCDVILYCVTFCKGGKEREREREYRSMLVFLLDIESRSIVVLLFFNKNVILIRKTFVCIYLSGKVNLISMPVGIGRFFYFIL